MALLYILQGIRSPITDYLALAFMCFGSELFFLCVSSVIFWCFSKKAAYKLVFTFAFFGPLIILANIIAQVPFPWISQAGLSTLPQIAAAAEGFSFPSIGIFTASVLCSVIFINNHNILVKISCVAVALLTIASYMYLGLCSTWSAAVSLVLAAAFSFIFTKFADGTLFDIRQYPLYLLISSIPTFILLVVSVFIYLNGLISLQVFSGTLRITGMTAALLFSWFFESTFVRFSIRCSRSGQFLKVVIGSASTIATWFVLYFVLNLIPDFWPAGFICNVIVTLGSFSAYPIFIRGVFSSAY